ncbi:hypothetical protein HYX70_04440 [Candidatus Saccharibacteria bacterium]|nr:hypothetical protein [Candidatus Saccharibacteria bacterium]
MAKESAVKKQAKSHEAFLVVLVVILLVLTISGWLMYYFRNQKANQDEQAAQENTQQLEAKVKSFEQNQQNKFLNEENSE